jgi:ParB family chromosome partitioning protein
MGGVAERAGRAERPPPEAARLDFDDPVTGQELAFTVLPVERLEVVRHQRKPSDAHVKRLAGSIERLGFLVPLVVVPRPGAGHTIIDGQHRFLAARSLGLERLPVVVVPEALARRMLGLNVEKEPNIRERAAVALSLYRELVEEHPDMGEDSAEVAEAVQRAHNVTLGLGYERSGRLAGSSFEPILARCDGFLDRPLAEALPERERRAARLDEASALVRAVAERLKEQGAWHQFVGAQIIAWANPLRRTRSRLSFDDAFDRMMERLRELEERPELALHASA